MRKAEKTQWAAMYSVAAELTRRDYRVGWPMGNAPIKDLLVESPTGIQFYVDVKGGSYKHTEKSYWHLVQKERVETTAIPLLYFIFVRVPPHPQEGSEFFILSHGELIKLYETIISLPLLKKDGTPYKDFTPGFQYNHLVPFRGRWDGLPT